jgi:uncharacterized protein YnzC (UPF0291/DUF896 family)
MIQTINLLPEGVKSEPLFKTEKEYQRFRKDFIESVAPEMEKHRIARMRSEHASRFHLLD